MNDGFCIAEDDLASLRVGRIGPAPGQLGALEAEALDRVVVRLHDPLEVAVCGHGGVS